MVLWKEQHGSLGCFLKEKETTTGVPCTSRTAKRSELSLYIGTLMFSLLFGGHGCTFVNVFHFMRTSDDTQEVIFPLHVSLGFLFGEHAKVCLSRL